MTLQVSEHMGDSEVMLGQDGMGPGGKPWASGLPCPPCFPPTNNSEPQLCAWHGEIPLYPPPPPAPQVGYLKQ